jgi:hypothetical protein
MSQLLRAGALVVVIFGNVGFATAQNAPGTDRPELTPMQQRTVSQGLASSPSQAAPAGAQPQVGDKVPDSMTAQSLPGDVTSQVPQVKIRIPSRCPKSSSSQTQPLRDRIPTVPSGPPARHAAMPNPRSTPSTARRFHE